MCVVQYSLQLVIRATWFLAEVAVPLISLGIKSILGRSNVLQDY